MQYARNNIDFRRGVFRVRGDVVEVFPAYEEDRVIRIEFFGDDVEAITEVEKKPDNKGRGKIFVLPIEECIRIRTGETGNDALS